MVCLECQWQSLHHGPLFGLIHKHENSLNAKCRFLKPMFGIGGHEGRITSGKGGAVAGSETGENEVDKRLKFASQNETRVIHSMDICNGTIIRKTLSRINLTILSTSTTCLDTQPLNCHRGWSGSTGQHKMPVLTDAPALSI